MKKKKKLSFKPVFICPKCGNNDDFVVYAKTDCKARLNFVYDRKLFGRDPIAKIAEQEIDNLPLKCDKVLCSKCGIEVYTGKKVPKLKIISYPGTGISEIEEKINFCSECGSYKPDAPLVKLEEGKEYCPECGQPWD